MREFAEEIKKVGIPVRKLSQCVRRGEGMRDPETAYQAEIEILKNQVKELEASLTEEFRINGMGQERELKLLDNNRQLKAVLTNVLDSVDEALLLDEHLAEAWNELRLTVIYGRKNLDLGEKK